jgi:predicted dehydrogenase
MTTLPLPTPIRLLVLGAGSRGFTYAGYAQNHPQEARVVGVAEPRPAYRQRFVEQFDVPAANVFTDWQEALARPRFADAVIIATPDAQHTGPALAAAALGYHILLEKPMAPSAAECRQVSAAVQQAGVTLAVAHVLRYTPYTRQVKAIVDSGVLGEVVSIQHLEPVGFWHQAHSYVRGNWRNTAESTFMLLAKSCHDLDWLRHIIGRPVEAVASFGSLYHFRPENKPAAAGEAVRCLDCAYEAECPYSARRIYLAMLAMGLRGWPLDVLTPEVNEANVLQALAEGPYGRCVYACDNDVVDHQVVALQYAGGASANFTMTAFNEAGGQRTTIFGTRGELRGDGRTLTHYDFLSNSTRTLDSASLGQDAASGHGGGDAGLMAGFLRALASGDPAHILSGPAESLETHLTVFAAEQARLEGRVVRVPGG